MACSVSLNNVDFDQSLKLMLILIYNGPEAQMPNYD